MSRFSKPHPSTNVFNELPKNNLWHNLNNTCEIMRDKFGN